MVIAMGRATGALATRVRTLEDDAEKRDREFALAKTQFEAKLAAAGAREEKLLMDGDMSRAAVRELQLELAAARKKAEESTATVERAAREEITQVETTLRGTREQLADSGARVIELDGSVRQLRGLVSARAWGKTFSSRGGG